MNAPKTRVEHLKFSPPSDFQRWIDANQGLPAPEKNNLKDPFLIMHPKDGNTLRGVYQGQRIGDIWHWLPDSCGLPPTFISDLTHDPDEKLMIAATMGRGAYTRVVQMPTADAYDLSTRNDTYSDTVLLSKTVRDNSLVAGLSLENLTLDRPKGPFSTGTRRPTFRPI